MTRLLTRRRLLGAGGAAALLPLGSRAQPAAAQTVSGQLVPLEAPIRLLDTRLPRGSSIPTPRKMEPGRTEFLLPLSSWIPQASAVFVNCTVTETEGSGYLVLHGSKGGLPSTSNINWYASDQTVGNTALVRLTNHEQLAVSCRGAGPTHVVIDLQGYISA